MEQRYEEAIQAAGARLRQYLENVPPRMQEQTQEIRLGAGRPVLLFTGEASYFLNAARPPSLQMGEDTLIASPGDIQSAFQRICEDSVYAYRREIQNGYVTIQGGHRVGICGTAVVQDGKVSNVRDISSVNIRVAREKPGVSSPLFEILGPHLLQGVLIAGPPASGKTTVLRDICRQISRGALGKRIKTAVVDERGEIAAVCNGIPQNDLGPCCDVLDGYPKGEGILQAIRCLSPQVVFCDELSGWEETQAIQQGVHAGVSLIATIHAASFPQLLKRPQARALLETGAFSFVVRLGAGNQVGQLAEWKRVGDLFAKTDGASASSLRLRCGRVFRSV